MKERPILFSGPMVRAILDGTKTQTRRILHTPMPDEFMEIKPFGNSCHAMFRHGDIKCPYGQPGDRLWVRETFYKSSSHRVRYRADDMIRLEDGSFVAAISNPPKWKPSIFMTRSSSRIDLVITCIRVERLNDISEEDAKAEGATSAMVRDYISPENCGNYRFYYQKLWESINGPGSWALNPWVWVVEFRKAEQ